MSNEHPEEPSPESGANDTEERPPESGASDSEERPPESGANDTGERPPESGASDTGDPPPNCGAETAATEEAEEDQFKLRVTKDRMQIELDCDTEGKDLDALADAILGRLVLFGVRKPPSIQQLRRWLRAEAEASPQIRDASVLKGTMPVEPVDGWIKWGGDFFNPGFLVDEATGRVNFRKRADERNVKAGQLLATIMQAVPGQNGIDVLGNLLRVRKPRRCKIRIGANLRADESTATYYSTIDGRIRWHDEMLSVDQLYEIEGDVGLETGDVSHQGAVRVQQDVLKGAHLQAIGDIEVMGVIDGAHVQCGGMLHVHGGITGTPGVRVIAAGGVHARYILDANVQSGGDIVVESEIMHANLATRGALLAPHGRVIGGKVVALGGIDIGQGGSTASVPTSLIAGEDYTLEGRLAVLKNKLKDNRENVDKIYATIAPLRGKIAALPEKAKIAIRTLLQQLPQMEGAIADVEKEIEDTRAASQADANPVILIRGIVYPETRLTISGETLYVREEVSGPLKPVYADGQLRLARTEMQALAKARR